MVKLTGIVTKEIRDKFFTLVESENANVRNIEDRTTISLLVGRLITEYVKSKETK